MEDMDDVKFDVTFDVDFLTLVQVLPNVKRMKRGDVTDREGLFGKALWWNLTPMERGHCFGPALDRLVMDGALPLKFVESDFVGEFNYRKK